MPASTTGAPTCNTLSRLSVTADGDQLTGPLASPGSFMDLKASCADLSRYVCFVCGCALAARVLAPLRLDEELWWFYVLSCSRVLVEWASNHSLALGVASGRTWFMGASEQAWGSCDIKKQIRWVVRGPSSRAALYS